MKNILNEIEADIVDIKNKSFQYTSTNLVPSRHDTSLTFERGSDKIGKEIETSVLYVDIRNSVELNRKHHTQTMGRIYTVFSKSMLKIARYHKGFVRNIVGDRVMIVFPSDNCFTNAVDCAVSIYHISHYLINKVFSDVEFRCGIGIDYGILKVVKVGLHRRGAEGFDNKNLVWVGHPANIASRLTDVANKSVDNSKVKVKYYPYGYSSFFGLSSIFGGTTRSSGKIYQDVPKEDLLTNEEFGKKLSFSDVLGITYSGGKLIRFDKVESKIDFPPILMTSTVYLGFKNKNPTRDSIKNNFWRKISDHNIKNVTGDVYGEQLIGKFNYMDNVEKATNKLDSINQWISNCDTKSSFVLTFFGVVLTIIFTSKVGEEMINTFSFQNVDEVNQKTVINFFLLLISLFFIIASLMTFYHIYLTLKGRINDKVYEQDNLNTNSNIFFRSIASKTFENFERDSNSEDESEYLNDLNSQVFINANIVTLKFEHYNKSLLWMSISLITFLTFILLK